MKNIALPSLLILFFLVCGCTGSNPQGRLKIEGDVSLGGKPLPSGSIEFAPTGSQSEKTQSGGEIKDGKYSIAAPQGLVPGEYLVRITCMEEVPGSRVDDPDPMKAKVEYRNVVPPEYGANSTQKVTVEKGKENKFDFNM